MEWEGDYLLDHSCSDCFLDTLPGDLDLALGDIDERLKDNAACIEQTVRELQSDLSELGVGEKLQNTGDCLQWLSNPNISSVKPFSTPCDQLTDFLKALHQFLKSERGPEETILQLLLDLSAECGVVFPLNSIGSSFTVPSATSVHAIEDSDSLHLQSVWDDVRLHLRRFLVDKLQNNQEINNLHQNVQFKTQCLQRLLFLYPESEILTKYQNIQSKSVQDLFQNSLLNNSGEISLDKMVHTFQNLIPMVCTMMRQDLYVLRTLMETSKVLKFVSDTYLQNIAEELFTLVERLCEQQSRENVIHLAKSSKNSNKQKGTVQPVVPQEQTKKARNQCLTAHQLRCLSQMMKILLHMEERVEYLASEVFLGSRVREQVRNVRGVLKKTSEDIDVSPVEMNKTNIQTEQLLFITESVSLESDWRDAFKDLALSAAHCLKLVIEDACAKSLQQEMKQSKSGIYLVTSIQLTDVNWVHCMEEEQSKKVAKFCSDIMEELDTLLPLALASSENVLQEIRANFVDGCSKVAAAVLSRLEERSKEVPSKAPVQNLYIILSSAMFICRQLNHYENLLKESSENRPVFLLPIQRYQEFITVIQFQVTDYCIRVCATSVLQDAESHHWGDSKPFYEGERCSFSIQMWHYYCCALRYDLYSVLPSTLAQELLAEVLSECLAILACRYSESSPTYNRTPQIRMDITAILLCTESLLWSICRSDKALLQPEEGISRWIFTIHSYCNTLLSTLAILTSPLEKLYTLYQNVFPEYISSSASENRCLLQWLCMMQPYLFSNKSLSPLSNDKIAVQRHLKLLFSQPDYNWNLLLQMLLLQDCLIPQILLSDIYADKEKNEDDASTKEKTDKESKLVQAIVMVMTYCESLPRCLSATLEGYIDRHQLWDQLYNLSAADTSEAAVVRSLKQFISKPLKKILKQVISLILVWQAVENPSIHHHKQILPESLLNKIPKEWDYIPREIKRRDSGKSFTRLVAQAVSIIIGNTPAAIASLPLPIKFLFNLVEKKLDKNISDLRQTCLLRCFIMIVCQTLEDGNAVEFLTCITIDRWGKEKLSLLSECLQTIMGQQKRSPNPIVQKVIHCLEKEKPKWIEGQLRKARRLCTESAFFTDEGSVLQEKGSLLELTEQKISMMVLDICHKPGGSEYLRQIYHIIQLNEDLLENRLCAQNSLDDNGTSLKSLEFTLLDLPQPMMFNPLQVFNHIGCKHFDQSAISEWKWDWSQLLHSNLGLSQLTFRALLANRWEMKADASLEEKEKHIVKHLQTLYFNSSKAE